MLLGVEYLLSVPAQGLADNYGRLAIEAFVTVARLYLRAGR